jgi:hypothetical protein
VEHPKKEDYLIVCTIATKLQRNCYLIASTWNKRQFIDCNSGMYNQYIKNKIALAIPALFSSTWNKSPCMESNSGCEVKLVFKCKRCDMRFDEKKRFEIHKSVHKHVKSRVFQYGTNMPWRPGL